MDSSPGEVTRLLKAMHAGDEAAAGQLLPLVYKELHRIAEAYMRRERPDHTLQSTALVHEAYLRLLAGQSMELKNRAHFIAVASRLMRQILVDYARERRAAKRDGGCRIEFESLEAMERFRDSLGFLEESNVRRGKLARGFPKNDVIALAIICRRISNRKQWINRNFVEIEPFERFLQECLRSIRDARRLRKLFLSIGVNLNSELNGPS